jgi:predicted transcriptional regulator
MEDIIYSRQKKEWDYGTVTTLFRRAIMKGNTDFKRCSSQDRERRMRKCSGGGYIDLSTLHVQV